MPLPGSRASTWPCSFIGWTDSSQGCTYLSATPAKLDKLKRAMHQHFEWSEPPGMQFPLRRLESGDARAAPDARSCFQDIAGDGVFSLGMIAEYRDALFTYGPWLDRQLFWETGVYRQVLAAFWRPKRRAKPTTPASAVSSTTRCTGCSVSATWSSSRSITSRSAARWRTADLPRWRPMVLRLCEREIWPARRESNPRQPA